MMIRIMKEKCGNLAKPWIILTLAFLFLFSIALGACKDKGPMEKAGETVDETFEKAGDKMEDAGDKIKDTFEDAGDAIEDAGDDMQN